MEIASGAVVTPDFELRPNAGDQPVRLGEFTMVADREMSAQAVPLNERRLAPNLINVVTYDEYGDRSAENIGDFLRFLPRVSIDEGGGQLAQNVIIRGLPAAQTGLELDGAQLATARGAGRTNTLFDVPTANISRVDALGAHSYSTSFSADIDNGHFNNMAATITGLVLRGEGIGEGGGVIPARYSATRRGVPVDLFDGANYVLGNPSSSQQKTYAHQTTARLDVTRDFTGGTP